MMDNTELIGMQAKNLEKGLKEGELNGQRL